MKTLSYASGLIFAFILNLGLSGCGGGSSASTSNTTTFSGRAVDGYISDATVCLDKNINGTCDSGEPAVRTDVNGTFTFTNVGVKPHQFLPVIVTSGTDTAINKAFQGSMSRILNTDNIDSNRLFVISALTDLVATSFIASKDKSVTSLTQIKTNIATALNLNVKKIDADPMQNKTLFAKTQELEQTKKLIFTAANKVDNRSMNEKELTKSIKIAMATSIKSTSILTPSDIIKKLENVHTSISIPSNEIDFITNQITEIKNKLTTMVSDTSLTTDTLNQQQNNLETTVESASTKIEETTGDSVIGVVELSLYKPANQSTTAVYLEPYLKNNTLKLLIPMYVYPNPFSIAWRKLIDFKKVYPNIQIVTIVDPDNGHFTKADPNYTQIIQELSDANISVIGYVHTSYGQRDIKEVESDIDAWVKFYNNLGVTGIFFDEADSDAKSLKYYTQLSQYARGKGFGMVVLNPGINVDSDYMDADIADIIVDHETTYTHLSDATTWNTPTKTTSLAMLIYGLDDSNITKTVQEAVNNSVDYIYFTNANEHPWNNISKYLALQTPFSKEEMQEALKVSKLQAPTSSYNPLWGTDYGDIEGVAHRYFYLNDNLVHFVMCGKKQRSELRFQDTWKVSTTTPKTIQAKLKVSLLDNNQTNEFTFLQIHSDGTQEGSINSPLIRIVWRKEYKNNLDHLWAILKLDTDETGTNYKKFDLGVRPNNLFTVKLSVAENRLNLWINQDNKINNEDVSYWSEYFNYFKAGVYLQEKGCAQSTFDTLSVD